MTTATTPYPELQQIIREETDNGRGIVRFLFKAMEGEFLNFTPTHRIMAGRVLGILGVEQGIEFVEANKKPKVPRDSAQRRILDDEAEAQLSAAERELSDYTKRVSKNGRRMVRFFLDAMDGLIKSFRPSLRIAAAKELIGCGFPLLTPARRRKTAKPAPQPAAQTPQPTPPPAPVAVAEPTVQSQTGHPELCSCYTCKETAVRKYAQIHCVDEEEIYQSIVRRAMTSTQDGEERVAEAARLWKETYEFVRELCPDAEIPAFPTWFPHIMEHDENYPSGYNPELVSELYYHFYGADFDDEDPDCSCEDCDDHERDQYGFCLCEICYEIEDDP